MHAVYNYLLLRRVYALYSLQVVLLTAEGIHFCGHFTREVIELKRVLRLPCLNLYTLEL